MTMTSTSDIKGAAGQRAISEPPEGTGTVSAQIPELQLEGFCHPDFQSLREAFRDNFIHHGETGAGLSVYYQGKAVVQLYGSYRSHNGPWQEKDRVCTMSCSKAPLALCLHLLAERGQLSLDDRVALHWPEFAQNGKEAVTLRQLLNHTAGLPVVRTCRNGDIFHWERMIRALEQAPLVFPAGETLAYHALTFGHLVGELIRRIDGRMPALFFQQEISQPLGIDYDLKTFPEHRPRSIAPHVQFRPLPLWLFSKLPLILPGWKMQFFRPCSTDYQPNSALWQRSELPAVSGQGSAQGLAKLYAFLANQGTLDGQQLCQPDTVAQLSAVSVNGTEQVSGKHWRMGLGFMVNSPDFVSFGDNPDSFGHVGMGGATGFADPDQKLAFGYVTEKYHHPDKQDKSMAGERLNRLIRQCYQCLPNTEGEF